MNADAKLPRHQPGRVPDSTRNPAQPSALRLQLDFSEAVRRQRNLRNSRTRDFRSSASGMEISVGMRENNSTRRESQRVAHASRVLASASSRSRTFLMLAYLHLLRNEAKDCFGVTPETSTRDACATLLAGRSGGLRLGARGFQAKNCFAFLHQIKAIASNRFEITHVCLKQGDLAGLPRQQILLLANL